MGDIIKMSNRMDFGIRPKCSIEGCDNDCQVHGKRKDGTRTFRKICQQHHYLTWHPYYGHRKDYCENVDGRLGFKCTTSIMWKGMLDVDHMDGNPSNNDISNLQTLCKCCHAYKTNVYGDNMTPGRKALGIKF